MILWFAACIHSGSAADTGADPVGGVPTVESFEVRCDSDDAKWRIDAVASALTLGATTVWTVDGLYVEVHEVPVSSSREDGTEDVLVLELDIEADFREVKPGKSTGFTCLSGVAIGLALRDVNNDVVDCAFEGDGALLAGVKGAPSCP